jgi:hypothetical protein
MRVRPLVFAALVFATGAPARAAEPAPVAAEVTFLGYRQRWSEAAPQGREPRDWNALAEWYDGNGAPAAQALKQIGDLLKLDPYGRLQLIRAAALAVPLNPDLAPVRFATALGRGWNAHSRAFFVADQVVRLGYPALVIEAGGRAFVGLPTVDGDLNADTQTLDVERSLLGVSQHVNRTYVLWDVEHRIGESGLERVDGTPLGKLERIFSQEAGQAFDFRKRALPEAVLARSEARALPWSGGRALPYKIFPDAAAYLAQFPEHGFAVQAMVDAADLRRTGLGAAVRAAAGGDEDAFVTQLLRAIQAGFAYDQGPLRPALEILAAARGDCDELSLLLALLLAEAGYPPGSIAAVTWESADHLGLALKSRSGKPPRSREARRFTLKGGDFFVIDTTYYHKRDDELITAWGEMNPENEPREASVVVLPALAR